MRGTVQTERSQGSATRHRRTAPVSHQERVRQSAAASRLSLRCFTATRILQAKVEGESSCCAAAHRDFRRSSWGKRSVIVRNGYTDLLRVMGTQRHVSCPRLKSRSEGNEKVMRPRSVCRGKRRTVACGEPNQLPDRIDAARRDNHELNVV